MVRRCLLALAAVLAVVGPAAAQPGTSPAAEPPRPMPVLPPAAAAPDNRPPADVNAELARTLKELERLQAQQPPAVADAERLRQQLELLQKQIEVLRKMAGLLAEQAKATEVQTATFEARTTQGARRDQELAAAVDDLRETADSERRAGPDLPATLRELFNPHRTNESPLGFYGTFAAQYEKFQDRPSNFPSPVFSPHFYILLNERLLLEVNPEFRGSGVELESCQIDWFAHDNLTVVVGRFYSPVGFFNERLHTSWIFKTPDRPLMFSQVLPASLSFNGAMLKGSVPLWDWPLKLEYSSVVTNGFSLGAAQPDARDLADLAGMADAFNDANGDKAFAGRLGIVIPACGVHMGISGMLNGAYDRAERFDLDLFDADASWHWGNWDVRGEFAHVNQETPGAPIRRRGWYGQVAYRPYDACNVHLSRLEAVFRFDAVRFSGIDAATAALDFGARERSPISRNRYTFGLNYYPYPSLIVKAAYEINDEVFGGDRRDNGFIAQVAWGF